MDSVHDLRLAEIISDADVARVHGRANFGGLSPREVIADGVWKYAVGFHSGHTQLQILLEHGLITTPKPGIYKANLTEKGKRYARALSSAGLLSALQSSPAPSGEAVPVAPAEAAYGALWRIVTDSPTIHALRRHLLGLIGGQGSDGQRRGVEWAVANMLKPSDAEIMQVDAAPGPAPAGDELRRAKEELSAMLGYLRNAKIDLQSGAPKATAIRTIEGGLKRGEKALADLGGA